MTELPSMTNLDFNELLKEYPEYGGCFSKDLVNSKNCKDNKVYVLNLDNAQNQGTHWVYMSTLDNADNENLYFDSYSSYPPQTVERFLQKQRKNTIANPKYENEQSLNSNLCGYFCLFFILLQLKMKWTPRQCINFFSDDTEWNERVITEFGKRVVKRLKEKN